MISARISGLILSAGYSGRMGKFKPLLKYEDETFLSTIIKKLLPVCNQIIVVTGFNRIAVEREIAQIKDKRFECKIQTVHNPYFQRGMFTSLKKGIEYIDESGWILYHFVDQPDLPQDFYKKFVLQIEDDVNWIQPVNNGQKGHPILFDTFVKDLIANANDSLSLKEVSADSGITKKFWECNYSQITSDIDTPEEYENLLESNYE